MVHPLPILALSTLSWYPKRSCQKDEGFGGIVPGSVHNGLAPVPLRVSRLHEGRLEGVMVHRLPAGVAGTKVRRKGFLFESVYCIVYGMP